MADTKGIRAGRAYVELFADGTKLAAGLRAAAAKLKAFGAAVSGLGIKMMAVGGALAAPFIAGARAFASFDDQMRMVSTMLDDADAHMAAFRDGVRRLAVEFGESTAVLSKGLYDLLSASVDPAQALDVLKVATKAAKAGMTDTSVAVDGLTSVLNAFQMSADRAGHVADVMFQTVKRGKLTFPDLAANIGKVAPMARAAGMSMENMMAAIATMTRQGLSTEEATTRLVNILKQVPEQAGDLAALAAKYVGKNLSQIQIDFPEVRAAGGIAALAADMGGFRKDLALMQQAAGRTDEAFGRMTGGVSFVMARAKQALEEVMTVIGEALADDLKSLADRLTRIGAGAAQWISQNRELVVTVAKVALATVAAGAGVFVLGKAIAGLGSVLGMVGTGIKFVIAALGALLSPVGLVIAGIVGAVAAFLLLTDTGQKVLEWLKGKFGELADEAKATFGAIGEALAAGDLKLAAQVLWAFLKLQWAKGTGWLLGKWYDFKEKLVQWATEGFYGIWAAYEIVAAKLKQAWAALKLAWRTVMATIQNKANEIAINIALDSKLKEAEENYASGKISKAGYDLAVRSVNEQRGTSLNQNNADYQAELAAAAGEAAAKNTQIEQEKNATLADIGNRSASARLEFERKRQQEQEALDADEKKARQEWTDAVEQSAKARKAAEGAAPPALGTPGKLVQDLTDLMAPGLAQDRISAVGTFSGGALAGLAGGVEQRAVVAAEKTAENTRRIVDLAKQPGARFA
ncbi:MAG: phage tail tape measure protein [Planctomycetaceae bacterium]|nr:phage tail tape measure protein [Planctomycetaceae bacterium]